MFISLMFAGHHTSCRHVGVDADRADPPHRVYAEVLAELEELYADGQEVSFQALRQIPELDDVVKEALRLHPPLIILMRVAKGDFDVADSRSTTATSSPHPRRSRTGSRGLPRPRRVQPGPLQQARAGGRRQPVDVDSLRRRAAPLRRGGVREDANQSHLRRAVARLGVRNRAALRQLPQRPLQDGRAAGDAGQGPLPQAPDSRNYGFSCQSRPGPVPGAWDVRAGGTRLLPVPQKGEVEIVDPSHPTMPATKSSGRSNVPDPSPPHRGNGDLTQ